MSHQMLQPSGPRHKIPCPVRNDTTMSTLNTATDDKPRPVRPRRPPVLQSMQVIVGDIFGRVRLARRGKPRGDRETTMAQVEVEQISLSPNTTPSAFYLWA